MEQLAQQFRSLRYGFLSKLPQPIYKIFRQVSLQILGLLSAGKGRKVMVAGIYPLQVEWERSAIDYNTWEIAFTREFGKTLQNKNFIVFDIGASIGEWSALAATLVGSHNVHVFEPDKPSWRHIRKLFSLNNLSPPKGIFEGFIANSDCNLDQEIWKKISSGEFPFIVHNPASFQSIKNPKEIPIVKLDTYCSKMSVIPDIIKIDVEGAEGEVLRGGEEVLNKFHPLIFLSLHPWALEDFGDSKPSLLNWLENQDYTCQLLGVDHEEHWLCKKKI
jgi:FkbM family methyltransferase